MTLRNIIPGMRIRVISNHWLRAYHIATVIGVAERDMGRWTVAFDDEFVGGGYMENIDGANRQCLDLDAGQMEAA